MDTLVQVITDEFIYLLFFVLGSWLIAEIKRVINTKIKNERFKNALYRLMVNVETSVNAVYQQHVKEAKRAGTWTNDSKKLALQIAKEKIQKKMSPNDITLFQNEEINLDVYIEDMIEQTIIRNKNANKNNKN